MRCIRSKLTILLLCVILVSGVAVSAHGASFPSPTSAFYVNDFAGILDADTVQYISNAASALNSHTTAQLVVVTISDIGDSSLADYSLGLFREWGIGSKDKNNGVLIFLDMGNRRSRIEVGYGLEGALPDGKTGRIQDEYMVPYFQENDFNQGVRQGFNALLSEIYNEYGIDIEDVANIEQPVRADDGIRIPPIVLIIGSLIVAFLIMVDFKVTGGLFTLGLLRSFFRGGGGGGGSSRGGGGSAGGGGSSRSW